MHRKSGRNSDGTFGPGNPGKPKGARHRITRAAAALLDGRAEEITEKAVALALEGDTTALRLCLERIVPPRKDAPITFTLPPMQSARDAAGAAASVLQAVAEGEITPAEGAQLMALVESYRRTLETTDIEERLTALERGRP